MENKFNYDALFPTISSLEYTTPELYNEIETSVSELFIPETSARLSQIEVSSHRKAVQEALEIASLVNPYEPEVPEGTERERQWSRVGGWL